MLDACTKGMNLQAEFEVSQHGNCRLAVLVRPAKLKQQAQACGDYFQLTRPDQAVADSFCDCQD